MLTEDAKARGVWAGDKTKKHKGKEVGRIEKGKFVTTEDDAHEAPEIDTADGEGVTAKVDLEDLKKSELAKMAKAKGLKLQKWASKEDIIEVIKKAQG